MNNRRPLFQSTIKPSSFSKVWRRLQRWRRYSIWPLVLHTKKVSSSYQMSWWCWLHERIKERSIWITWWAVGFCLCHDQIYPIPPISVISKCPPLLYWQLIGGQFLKSSPPPSTRPFLYSVGDDWFSPRSLWKPYDPPTVHSSSSHPPAGVK